MQDEAEAIAGIALEAIAIGRLATEAGVPGQCQRIAADRNHAARPGPADLFRTFGKLIGHHTAIRLRRRSAGHRQRDGEQRNPAGHSNGAASDCALSPANQLDASGRNSSQTAQAVSTKVARLNTVLSAPTTG
jgi:hypothetical protein